MTDAPKFTRMPIADASVDDLRYFAGTHLGLDGITEKDTKQSLLAKMSAAGYGLPTIMMPNPDAVIPVQDSGQSGRRTRQMNGREEVEIRISKSEGAGGSRNVLVGVNGKQNYIPRGVNTWVETAYVEVLENAVELQYPVYDADGNFLGGLKEPEAVPTYPFSYV